MEGRETELTNGSSIERSGNKKLLRDLVIQQLQTQNYQFELLSQMTPQDLSEDSRFGPQRSKILAGKIEQGFKPEDTTWLGGICSLFTADGERIRKKETTFTNESAFDAWLRSWYPRLDQVHDTVGVPPASAKGVVYVVEDSIFGRRVANWTGLNADDLSKIFKNVHEEHGGPAIEKWLRNYGYQGSVNCVYTSELEKDLDLSLRIWERSLGKPFSPNKRDWAKVEMMYTPLWPSILGLSKAIIAEPCHHGTKLPSATFGNGLSQVGFLPYWGETGTTRNLPYTEVPNIGNVANFTRWDTEWNKINLEFNAKNPLNFTPEALVNRAGQLVKKIYKK